MRSIFPGSYPPSDDDFKAMWAEGMFVFDTSMLLNFYRYSEETRQEFLGIVSSPEMAPRIWIPYRVAEEYHRNLDSVRHEQVAACVKMRSAIEEWANSLRAGDHKKRAEQLLGLAHKFVAEAEEQYRHPDRQALIEQIACLFEGKVGPEWDEKRLGDLFKEGEKRYKSKIPPGFKDKQKQDDDQYGDLIVWFQMIEEAEKRKKPVLLVTDDLKEDWWLRVGGKTVGPLPALRNEMHRKAGVNFHMYPGDRFLEYARTSLKRPVADETVAEVKQVREHQQASWHAFEQIRREVDLARAALHASRQQAEHLDAVLASPMIPSERHALERRRDEAFRNMQVAESRAKMLIEELHAARAAAQAAEVAAEAATVRAARRRR